MRRTVAVASFAVLLSGVLSAEKPAQSASGSGFFITPDGYFLTSYHVVKNADKIQILAGDGLSDVKLVKADPANDIAILKAEGEYISLPIGLPGKLSIGDDVFTIGFPDPLIQGLTPKLTKGNISAASGLQDDPRFFQISIPVQPGNSGGPLVDEHGNVVGIVSASLSEVVALSRGFIPQNVNYAVKIAYAAPLVDSIKGIGEKLLPPVSETTKTPSQIREAAEKAVGLVVIYKIQHSRPRTANAEPGAPHQTGGQPHSKGAPPATAHVSQSRRVTLRNVQTGEICYGGFNVSQMQGWVVLPDGTRVAGRLSGVGASHDSSGKWFGDGGLLVSANRKKYMVLQVTREGSITTEGTGVGVTNDGRKFEISW